MESLNEKEKIARKEFLIKLGFGGASLVALYCTGALSACSTSKKPTAVTVNTPPPSTKPMAQPSANALAMVNLNMNLKMIGDFVSNNGIVIVRIAEGDKPESFAAVTKVCPHNQQMKIGFDGKGFTCAAHGASFDTMGNPVNDVTSRKLRVFKNISIKDGLLEVLL